MITVKDRYINPFTDFGFKKIFGEEANKDLLIDFLNQLLKDKVVIKDLKYLQGEKLGRTAEERKAIFDLFCESDDGEKFIIELQRAKQEYFKDRSIYYSTFPIQEQALKGDWKYQLKAVYTIAIMDFKFNDTDEEQYLHEVRLVETRTKKVFYDKLSFVYIEMPKFNKPLEKLETLFEKWIYVLKALPNLQERPGALQERVFKKLFKVAEIAKYNKEEQYAYQNSLKAYWDFRETIRTAVKDTVEGIIIDGLKEGLSPFVLSKITKVPTPTILKIQKELNSKPS